jgi:ribose transport system permease protein
MPSDVQPRKIIPLAGSPPLPLPAGGAGVPIAVACGALVGLANGLGVAFLRIPSMVFTLGMNAVVQGMVVMYTGGNAPPDQATPILQWLAVRETFYVPHAVVVWALVGVLVIVALKRTPFGR